MEEYFDGMLEEIFWEITRHSYDSGKVIGRLKNSRDPDDILKYKYHLGRYFAYKFVRYMIQVIAGRIKKFKDVDEFMIEAELNFVQYCNLLPATKIYTMELMFSDIVEKYREKYDGINKYRFPDFYRITKGKHDAYLDCHKVFSRMGLYSRSRTITE